MVEVHEKITLSKPESVRGIVLCVFFGILMALLIVELFLRLSGWAYNFVKIPPVDRGASYKIFCVGESTTWGIGASDTVRFGYPHQLEEKLNSRFGSGTVQCLFDQTIGQNTSEILLKLPNYIAKYKPQLVILMVGVNNWWNMDRSNIVLFSKKNVFSPLTIQVLVFLDQFRVWKLSKYLALSFGLYKERWNYWCPQGAGWTELKKNDDADGHLVYEELARYDIDSMIRICRKSGVKVVISTYPRGSDRLLEIHRSLARKYTLPLVDNYVLFSRLPDLDNYLWSDHWHPNDRGYALMADNIYNVIVRDLLTELRN